MSHNHIIIKQEKLWEYYMLKTPYYYDKELTISFDRNNMMKDFDFINRDKLEDMKGKLELLISQKKSQYLSERLLWCSAPFWPLNQNLEL